MSKLLEIKSHEDVASSKWIPVIIEGKKFYIKAHFEDEKYLLMVTDLFETYLEEMSDKALKERFIKLNPKVEFPDNNFCNMLRADVQSWIEDKNVPHVKLMILHQTSSSVHLRSTIYISNATIHWDYQMTAVDAKTVYTHLTQPLLGMCQELSRRNQELLKIIEDKDAFISDCLTSGTNASKVEHLKPFDKEEFEKKMNKQEDVLKSLGMIENVLSEPLYSHITSAVREMSMEEKASKSSPILKRPKIEALPEIDEKKEEEERRLKLQDQPTKVKVEKKKTLKI